MDKKAIVTTPSSKTEALGVKLAQLYEKALLEEKKIVYRHITLSIFNSAMNMLNEETVPNKIVNKDYSSKFKALTSDSAQVSDLVKKLKQDVADYEDDLFRSIGDRLAEKL